MADELQSCVDIEILNAKKSGLITSPREESKKKFTLLLRELINDEEAQKVLNDLMVILHHKLSAGQAKRLKEEVTANPILCGQICFCVQ